LDLDPTLRTPSSHRSNTARWIRNGRLRFKTRANRYGEVPSAGSRSYGSDLNNTRSNLAHSLQIERSGVFGCRGRRCYCSGDAFRGGASPALAKSILRGPIQAGPEPKRTRGTRRALLGAQCSWPELVRDLCWRGAALVAVEQRGRGSGSSLSQAWHGTAPARPQETTKGLSTGIRHRRRAVDGKGLTRGGEGRLVLVEGGLGAALQGSWYLGQWRTPTGKIVPRLTARRGDGKADCGGGSILTRGNVGSNPTQRLGLGCAGGWRWLRVAREQLQIRRGGGGEWPPRRADQPSSGAPAPHGAVS
jgi:hypothetical protein